MTKLAAFPKNFGSRASISSTTPSSTYPLDLLKGDLAVPKRVYEVAFEYRFSELQLPQASTLNNGVQW